MKTHAILRELKRLANPAKREVLMRFFKTGKGQYGEGNLIHKAVCWLLREVGKRDRSVLESYLAVRYKKMPRTMLRYAIEKFSESQRQEYLRT